MKAVRFTRAFGAASVSLAIALSAGGVASASNSHHARSARSTHTAVSSAHALFVETDSPVSNQVLSYERSTDGTVAFSGSFATGGLGATAVNAVADPLASQGGLVLLNGNRDLIAVNAGSDTISLFSVKGTVLTLTQRISSGGSFPDSVATRGNFVAVLNAGGAGTVTEFTLVKNRLVAQPSETRSLGLANTTPPEFVHGPGQVGYSPDGKFLVVTTKHSTDAYEVFTVGSDGTLAATPVITKALNAVPFAFNFDAAGHLVGVEASNSSLSTYTINADGSLTSLGTVSDGAKALCWIASAKGFFYGDNAASASVSSFSENTSGAPVLVNAVAANAHAGTTDSTTSPDGRFLYVESGGAGTLDVYAIDNAGTLTPEETVWNIPVASEGIAAS